MHLCNHLKYDIGHYGYLIQKLFFILLYYFITGKSRLVSDCLKGEIDVDNLVRLSRYIQEEALKDSKKDIHMNDDYLKKTGID